MKEIIKSILGAVTGGIYGYVVAAAIGAAAAGGGAWVVQGWRYGATIADMETAQAKELAKRNADVATAQATARTEEQRRQSAIDEVRNEAEQNLSRVVASERAAADQRVRNAVNTYASAHRPAASNSRAAKPSAPATDPIGVLAELLGQLDDLAEGYAHAADRSRAAGLACERSYDALRPRLGK